MTEKTWCEKIAAKCGKNWETQMQLKVGNFFEVFFTIFFNLLFAFLVLNFYDDLSFILKEPFREDILPLYVIVMLVFAVTNFTKLLVQAFWYKKVIGIINNIFSIILTIQFYEIFPFDFTKLIDWSSINEVAKVLLILAIVGTIIAIVSDTFKLISGSNAKE